MNFSARHTRRMVACLILFAPSLAWALTCWTAEYAQMTAQAEVAVHARVVDVNPGSAGVQVRWPDIEVLELEVLQPLKGAAVGEHLYLRSALPGLMQPMLDTFPLGSEWILFLKARSPSKERSREGSKRTVYGISCASFYAQVEHGKVDPWALNTYGTQARWEKWARSRVSAGALERLEAEAADKAARSMPVAEFMRRYQDPELFKTDGD